MRKAVAVVALLSIVALVALAGCGSQADTASKNISTRCEKFECQRRIVGVNGITDKVEFLVEGRCSIEGDGLGKLNALIVTCKQGPKDYRKHYVGMSDNLFFIETQLQGIAVSEYRTKVVLKPQGIVPDLDLVTG
jgi:hypothetical protein